MSGEAADLPGSRIMEGLKRRYMAPNAGSSSISIAYQSLGGHLAWEGFIMMRQCMAYHRRDGSGSVVAGAYGPVAWR